MEEYLTKLYTDVNNSGSFASASRLWKEARKTYPKLSLKTVKHFLESRPEYTLHRNVRKHFDRAPVITNGLHEQADLDLADVSRLASANGGIHFLIIMIDPFSRFALVEPIKNKSAKTVVSGMKRMLSRHPRIPKTIRHDEGTEFVNSQFKTLMKQHNIRTYVAKGAPKANYAERFIRTLKNKLYRYMTYRQTNKYLEVLQAMVDSYNNSFHHSIKMKPTDVTEKNESMLWQQLYLDRQKPSNTRKKHKYKIGQHVRVAIRKGPLGKGYTHNWSETVYTIRDALYRNCFPVYALSDLHGRPKQRMYYEQELQPIRISKEKQVHKIIQSRRKGKTTEYHVRWKNFGPEYDQWLTKEKLNKYM